MAYFNDENLRVLYILGHTPSFSGIRPHDDDTPIEVSTKNIAGNSSNAAQYHGTLINETSAITATVNTGKCNFSPVTFSHRKYYKCTAL